MKSIIDINRQKLLRRMVMCPLFLPPAGRLEEETPPRNLAQLLLANLSVVAAVVVVVVVVFVVIWMSPTT